MFLTVRNVRAEFPAITRPVKSPRLNSKKKNGTNKSFTNLPEFSSHLCVDAKKIVVVGNNASETAKTPKSVNAGI